MSDRRSRARLTVIKKPRASRSAEAFQTVFGRKASFLPGPRPTPVETEMMVKTFFARAWAFCIIHRNGIMNGPNRRPLVVTVTILLLFERGAAVVHEKKIKRCPCETIFIYLFIFINSGLMPFYCLRFNAQIAIYNIKESSEKKPDIYFAPWVFFAFGRDNGDGCKVL